MASNHIARVTAGGLTNAHIAHSLYGYCTTAAGTVAKAVSLYSDGTTAGGTWAAADLTPGLTITVRFQYSNTASSPTLNVNGTGAKPIYAYGTTRPGNTVLKSWPAQGIVTFTYDTLLNTSGCWVMNNYADATPVYDEVLPSDCITLNVGNSTTYTGTKILTIATNDDFSLWANL